jgi:hypothetical protein
VGAGAGAFADARIAANGLLAGCDVAVVFAGCDVAVVVCAADCVVDVVGAVKAEKAVSAGFSVSDDVGAAAVEGAGAPVDGAGAADDDVAAGARS